MVKRTDQFTIKATNRRGPPQCPPDPRYPDGIDVNLTVSVDQACKVELPYPAPERLIWNVTCKRCGFRAGVTAAGRPDDPRSITLPCGALLQ